MPLWALKQSAYRQPMVWGMILDAGVIVGCKLEARQPIRQGALRMHSVLLRCSTRIQQGPQTNTLRRSAPVRARAHARLYMRVSVHVCVYVS